MHDLIVRGRRIIVGKIRNYLKVSKMELDEFSIKT